MVYVGNSKNVKRNGNLDIKASILYALHHGYKNIRSFTNTNGIQFNGHLKDLKESGLVEENENGKEVTEKGKEFLKQYYELMGLME